ncbi:MAG: MFS transporter [Gammaproteobacteria bacterium]|nr:MFS transporter [Gammaproteobacteria bacterium]
MQKNNKIAALIGMGILNFLGCLDLTIVNTALPAIQHSFQVGDTTLQWAINALLLALTATMVLVGKLGDRYGRRMMLYVGMILFAVTSLGALLTPSFGGLVFFRFFQGISIGILYTAPIALMPTVFPGQVEKAMSVMIGISGLGLALGPVLGGVLTSLFSWHAIFFINLPLTALAYLFCRGNVPEVKSEKLEKLDIPGALLMAITLPLLIYTTVNIHIAPISQTLLAYAVTLVLALVFVWRENKALSPMIDFHLFANRHFIVGLIANFFMAFFYTNAFFFIPLHLNQLGIQSSFEIGLILLPAMLMVAIFSPISSRLCKRWSTQKVMMMGYGFFILSAILQLALMHSTQLPLLLISYIAFGLGWAFVLSPSLVAGVSSLPQDMGGVAIGSLGTFHNLGGTVGLAIGATLGYTHAMSMVLVTSILAFGVVYFGLARKKSLLF